MRLRACRALADNAIRARRALSMTMLEKVEAVDVQHFHPAVQDFTARLVQTQPCFSLNAHHITIFSKPKDFHALLFDMIRRARRRVFLSSLYIGSSEVGLIKALDRALQLNPDLNVYLHLDYNRSTRPGSVSTAQLLTHLLRLYPTRAHAYFFKSPKLKGIMAKLVPRRFDEGWGTWHAKIYGIDDEVVITGANLNDSYFSDRQDRYLHFMSSTMSEYCYSFLEVMRPYCFQLEAPNNISYSLSWGSPTHPEWIEDEANRDLLNFQEKQRLSSLARLLVDPPSNSDVLIFPIIQAGQFKIREEEHCLDILFKYLDRYSGLNGKNPLVDLTSGYFGLYEPYQRLIQETRTDCRIVCASPKANGFYGSAGISGRIPEGYRLLEQRFWRGVERVGRRWQRGHGVQLHEWEREGWTYHAKGLWVSPAHNAEGQGHPPVLTLFGSTNLNSRSANLDTELSFIMVVPSSGKDQDGSAEGLRIRLGEEMYWLRSYAVPWRGCAEKIRAGTAMLVSLIGGML